MTTQTTRWFAALALLAACLLTPVPPASAAPIILDAGQACAFPLSLSGSDGRVRVKEFTDKKTGKVARILQVATGVTLTYTNLTPGGKSVSIKTSGSVWHIVNNPDGTQTWTMTGHNGLVLFPTDIPAGPTTTQYDGRVVFKFNPVDGFTILISTSGKARDICAELS